MCNPCFEEEMEVKEEAEEKNGESIFNDAKDEQGEPILYATMSICPTCLIKSNKSEKIKGLVKEEDGKVYLMVTCPEHGEFKTLYCSDVGAFKQIFSFSESTPPKIDIEDLNKTVVTPPFVCDIDLWERGELIDDDFLVEQVKKCANLYPKGVSFVLRLGGGLCNEMEKLNSKILTALKFCLGPVLIDLSFDRMINLARVKDSVLLKGSAYPCIRYFIAANDAEHDYEQECVEELSELLNVLKTEISEMQAILQLSVDRPYPNLERIFSFIFQNKAIIRFVIISSDRSPRNLVETLANDDRSALSVDPLELLHHISKATNQKILVSDFFPARVGLTLEPFIRLLDLGNFIIRPSPYCGFVSCLITTENHNGVPASRFVNFRRLNKELRPHITTIEDAGYAGMKLLRKLVNKCAIQKVDFTGHNAPPQFVPFFVPSILSYLDSSKREEVNKTVRTAQWIIVHNTMDFAAIDATRKTNCTILKPKNGGNGNAFQTACTGCL